MEDLREKIASEKTRIGRMEDDALQMMDAIQVGGAGLTSAQALLVERETQIGSQIQNAKTEIGAAEAAIVDQEQRRAEAAAALPTYLLSQYDALRAKFANPVATVDHGICAGCKLRVSGNTAERARGSMGIVTCEHCSRILYMV
jgi:predicted  nucleic acid-binding Zn-ribbon protein